MRRRPRLVPKVVFHLAISATAVPALAGCHHEEHRDTSLPVACCGYQGVAQQAYTAVPVEVTDASLMVRVPVGVAQYAYQHQPPPGPVDAGKKVEPVLPPSPVAARGYGK